MADNPEVLAAKRDLSYLLSILGIQSNKTSEMHAPCPVCGDRTCLQFSPDKKRLGEWYWKCHKGCGGGDVVNALVTVGRLSFKDAFAKIRKDFAGRVPKSEHDEYHRQRAAEYKAGKNGTQNGIVHSNGINPHGYTAGVVGSLAALGGTGPLQIPQKAEAPEPVIDTDRAEEFIDKQHEYLMNNFDLVVKWGRGLSRQVCEKYRIGFIEHGKTVFAPWQKPMEIPAAWVLPITNADKEVKGVKVHFEERPYWGDRQCPKLLWLPFGTSPAYKRTPTADGKFIETKPVHAYSTMWPHPDTLRSVIQSDFSLEASFWIQRIPDNLREEWNSIMEVQGHKFAYEREKILEDLDGPELWQVQLRAFEEMKKKIFNAVLKIKDAETAEKMKNKKQKREMDWSECIFICPGELKALACESSGMMATATTGGESTLPSSKLLSKFAGQKVCLFGDEDTPKKVSDKADPTVIKKVFCTGKEWVDKWTKALEMHGVSSVMVKYGGQKGKNE